jgi:hypothetical protein
MQILSAEEDINNKLKRFQYMCGTIRRTWGTKQRKIQSENSIKPWDCRTRYMEVKSGHLEEDTRYDWKQQICGFYGMQQFILHGTR